MNPLTNTRNLQKINEKELELGLTGTRSSWHDGYSQSAWIFVGGLPYDLTEGDIITVFSQYGEIVNINMARDKITGKQKGFAFICYEDQRSTILAVDNLNSIKILNRIIRVDHVKDYKAYELKGTEDEITQKIRLEGCGPDVNIEKMSKKLRKKDKESGGDEDDGKKKKQKKKRHGSESGSDEDPEIKTEVESDAAERNLKGEDGSTALKSSTLSEVNEKLTDLQRKMKSLGRRIDGECGGEKDHGDDELLNKVDSSNRRNKSRDDDDYRSGKSSKTASYSPHKDKVRQKHDDDDDSQPHTSSRHVGDKLRSPKNKRQHVDDEPKHRRYSDDDDGSKRNDNRRKHDDNDYRTSKSCRSEDNGGRSKYRTHDKDDDKYKKHDDDKYKKHDDDKYKRHDDKNKKRADDDKYRRHDVDDNTSRYRKRNDYERSPYKKRHSDDDDDYKSSKYRRDNVGHRRRS